MSNPIDTLTTQLQAVATKLRNGNINQSFAASELDRINANFASNNEAFAVAIEATIADIETSKDDISTAVQKVAAVTSQLKATLDVAVVDQQAEAIKGDA